ncbi:phage tail family protein [Listeria monocytogenes]|nr:phage tail family protein [Listeria monocytogenes]EIM2067691.1 phage tail family protein [Listeria monocytogenes]EIM2090378.1 phage tail family protein [Listeria monocytogenes]EIM2257997.1 phage tail family protein [Listeria monocytogenes]
MTKHSKMYILKQDSDKEIDADSLACVTFLQFVRDSPQLSTTFYEFAGADGAIEGDSVFKSKKITCDFLIQANSVDNYKLAEQEFYNFFYERKSYYIRFSRTPGIRYKVIPEVAAVELSKNGKIAKITLELNNFTGYAESVHSSLMTQDVEDSWQFGQGILADDYSYTHHANHFSIYNPGSITVDPRLHFLRILIIGDAYGDFVMENQTTLERFECTKKFNVGNKDVLTLEQTSPKVNGIPIGMETNGGLISLAPGKNDIVLKNIARTFVTFDFHSLHV